jgi:hypothetical protein
MEAEQKQNRQNEKRSAPPAVHTARLAPHLADRTSIRQWMLLVWLRQWLGVCRLSLHAGQGT